LLRRWNTFETAGITAAAPRSSMLRAAAEFVYWELVQAWSLGAYCCCRDAGVLQGAATTLA
jgi:hypothetical protein